VKRKSALFLSGILTAFVMVVVVGLVLLSGRAAQVAQAAAADTPTIQAPDPSTTTDVATLQAEVQSYKQALQKRDVDLQSAYNQIQTLNNQLNQLTQSVQQLQSGGFSSGRRSGGGGFNTVPQPFLGGGDD
jgi:peptidoglycan hydrolase CwlO-like protein